MAWSNPKNWTNEPLTASDMNTYLSDNLSALKDPPSAIYDIDEASDLTFTATTFTDLVVTAVEGDFQHTIDTNGGDVMIGFRLALGVSADMFVAFDVSLDGTRIGAGAGATDGLWGKRVVATASNTDDMASCFHIQQGIAAGSHVFKLQAKIPSGTLTIFRAAGTSQGDILGQFWVREMS